MFAMLTFVIPLLGHLSINTRRRNPIMVTEMQPKDEHLLQVLKASTDTAIFG